MTRDLLFMLVLLTACGGRQPTMYPDPEPLVTPAPREEIWRAAIDVATEMRFPITTIDAASGYLRTDRVWTPEPSPGAWWDCGSARGPSWNEWESDSTARAPIGQIADGEFYLTSKRVIFNGTRRNSTIRLSNLISFQVFSDGLALEKGSGRSPHFELTGDTELAATILSTLLAQPAR